MGYQDVIYIHLAKNNKSQAVVNMMILTATRHFLII
jgi:hypothetical protein